MSYAAELQQQFGPLHEEIRRLKRSLHEIDRISCGNKGERQAEFDEIRKWIGRGLAA
jgi:hypothetical protein